MAQLGPAAVFDRRAGPWFIAENAGHICGTVSRPRLILLLPDASLSLTTVGKICVLFSLVWDDASKRLTWTIWRLWPLRP